MTILESERLVLRPYDDGDAARVLDILSRDEVIRWLGAPQAPMADLAAALAWVATRRRREADDPYDVTRAVVVRDTGAHAGSVSLARAHRHEVGFVGEYEVGWHLHPDSVGHGYATEAAEALLDDVFARGLAEAWCGMYLGNDASQKVAERLGLPFVGVGPDPWWDGDSRLYRVTREEWLAR